MHMRLYWMSARRIISVSVNDGDAYWIPRTSAGALAAFEFHLLPHLLRRRGEDIVDRVRCPPNYIGVSVMTAVAALRAS